MSKSRMIDISNNNMISIERTHYAVFAGLSGTAASIFGKLISQTDAILNNVFSCSSQQEFYCDWSLKVIFIALMISCNIFVWLFFVKSLQGQRGSVISTVISTSTNYCCSAIVGSWIFEEQVMPLWWFGTSSIVIGLILISLGTKDEKKTK